MRTHALPSLAALLSVPVLAFLSGHARAQTISNPGFEADTYTAFPGYAAGNGGVITGWTSTKPASVGLNPAAGSPFADNGTIPAGPNVAFLQSTAGGTDLSTTITGLTPGSSYRVNFRANARGGQNPVLKATVDGGPVNLTLDFAPPAAALTVTSVNSANPYHYVSFEFTAGASTAALTLLNDAAGDNTVCVDDFSITAASAVPVTGIVATRWTGDADSAIDSQYLYTHAHTFGAGAVQTTVNGVLFTPTAGGNPNVQNHMVWSGFINLFGDQTRAISGGSTNLAKSFMYGGPNTGVVISGLKANTTYVATIYGVGWENGTRAADFSGSAGGGPVNVNLDAYGLTNGITVRYRYTTDANGTAVTLSYPQAAGAGSFHTAGFSNREAAPGSAANTWSTALWTNNATSGVNDGATYQYTHAYNLNSGTNATINGVTFKGKAGANPSDVNFSMSGFGSGFANDANNVTDAGGSRTLANDFLYNGFPGSLTLTGLTPGTQYQLTLFSVGFDDAPTRITSYVGYSQTGAVYSQNLYGNNNGIRINYIYTAPASGSITITTNPVDMAAGSLHLYGFANRKTTPETALAVTVHPQPVYVTQATGGTATFSSSASGNLPLSYAWHKVGNPTPVATGTTNLTATLTLNNVTAADSGDYTCSFTGTGQGTVTSNPARLNFIPDRVAGLFDTGFGKNGAVLPDGAADPHYLITVNPDGAGLIPATVHDSSVFPIVTGPWLANTALSKWIAPQFNTSGSQGEGTDAGAGPGVYVYRTTFDLTGFSLPSVRITGGWATDNDGLDIRVNGISTGMANPNQFTTLTPFVLDSTNATFQTGVNTLEFRVRNATVSPGYTGLRVEGMQGFGSMNPGTGPYIVEQPANTVIPWGQTNSLSVAAGGSASLTYVWKRNSVTVSGASGPLLTLTANDPAVAGSYTVTVSNGSGSVTSDPAIVSLTGVPPWPGSVSMTLEPGVSGKLTTASVVAAATGGSAPLTVSGVQSGFTAGGGTVSLVDGWIVYQPAAGFTGADSFTYTLTDGVQSTSGTITVVVSTGAGTTFNMVGIPPEGDGRRIVALGIPGRTYKVQYTSDLANWTDLGSPQTCGNNGVISILDPGPLPPNRYYRVVETTAVLSL